MKESELKKLLGGNMTQGNRFISDLLQSYEPGQRIDSSIISKLVSYHPTKSIENYEYLTMLPFNGRTAGYNNLALHFYKDKIFDDISWKKCIRNLFGKFDKNKDNTEKNKKLFRQTSDKGTKKDFFYNNQTKICELCGDKERIEVDHFPLPYAMIEEEFIEAYNIDFKTLTEDEYYELWDTEWLRFHDKNARYRFLCKSCNIKCGARSEGILLPQ